MLWITVKTHVNEQLGVACLKVMGDDEALYRIRHVFRVDSELWTALLFIVSAMSSV